MHLVTFSHLGIQRFGVQLGEKVVDLNGAYRLRLQQQAALDAAVRAQADCPADALSFLSGGRRVLDVARETLQWLESHPQDPEGTGPVYAASAVRLHAPVPRPGKIICIGLNYADHAAETGLSLPEVPTVFSKYANAVVGPGQGVEKPRVSDQVDWEVELGVVIGTRGRAIPEEQAMGYVAGYTVVNDVSVRDYQMKTGQWTLGKTFDTHCPIGPALVTRDEIADPPILDISCSVNGERMQHSNTRQLIFKIPTLIAYLSQVMTLEPGDLIATGTPHGVGFARDPRVFLKVGDTVTAEVEGVGSLENPIIPQT